MTRHQLAHMEAAVNVVVAVILAQLILFIYGMPLHDAAVLNGIFIIVTYIRSFAIRLIFARLAR